MISSRAVRCSRSVGKSSAMLTSSTPTASTTRAGLDDIACRPIYSVINTNDNNNNNTIIMY